MMHNLYQFFTCCYFKLLRGYCVFKFQNNFYRYFIHEYNQTWDNERTIEIPIIKKLIDKKINPAVLEIGNVLSHYFSFKHDIIDKYEKGKNVINADASGFRLNKKYDIIVSISTLEHIGWDEEKKDSKKVLKAIDNLKSHLKKNGSIIFTHPLGYNPIFDAYIKNNSVNCREKFLLKRISKSNKWQEIAWKRIFEAFQYNAPFPYANGVVIGVI